MTMITWRRWSDIRLVLVLDDVIVIVVGRRPSVMTWQRIVRAQSGVDVVGAFSDRWSHRVADADSRRRTVRLQTVLLRIASWYRPRAFYVSQQAAAAVYRRRRLWRHFRCRYGRRGESRVDVGSTRRGRPEAEVGGGSGGGAGRHDAVGGVPTHSFVDVVAAFGRGPCRRQRRRREYTASGAGGGVDRPSASRRTVRVEAERERAGRGGGGQRRERVMRMMALLIKMMLLMTLIRMLVIMVIRIVRRAICTVHLSNYRRSTAAILATINVHDHCSAMPTPVPAARSNAGCY